MAEQALITGMGGKEPDIDVDAFVAPTSVVIGEVTLAPGSSVWYQAVLRADCGPITLGPDSNIQDNCSVHTDPGFPLTVGARVSVGHNAVLHGCVIEDDVLVGMGATVLNGAHIGAGSLVAAQALVPQGMRVPPGSLVAGVPAKVKRPLTAEELRASASTRRGTWSWRRRTARRTRADARSRHPTNSGRAAALPFQEGGGPVSCAYGVSRAYGCGQPLGRRVHTTVISPVTAPSARVISMATGNSGRCPASSSATTSAIGRPRVAVAVTSPMASFL